MKEAVPCDCRLFSPGDAGPKTGLGVGSGAEEGTADVEASSSPDAIVSTGVACSTEFSVSVGAFILGLHWVAASTYRTRCGGVRYVTGDVDFDGGCRVGEGA